MPARIVLTEGETMKPEIRVEPIKPDNRVRNIALLAGALLVVFLLGFVPMWLKARQATGSLAKVEITLRQARMQNDLASAVIDARRGDYEPARQAASRFFTSLSQESEKGDSSALSTTQIEASKTLFTQRDEIITLLARSDPAAADRLSDLYVAFRKIVNG